MFVAAIKCDFCLRAHEIPCRKSGDTPKVPDGWAVISPMVRVQGTPQTGSLVDGKEWNPVTQKFDKEPGEHGKEKLKIKKLYSERRDKLRAKFDKCHVCEDCIEEILTGKRSIKIGMGGSDE